MKMIYTMKCLSKNYLELTGIKSLILAAEFNYLIEGKIK